MYSGRRYEFFLRIRVLEFFLRNMRFLQAAVTNLFVSEVRDFAGGDQVVHSQVNGEKAYK